jgi:hypothetical protein
MRSLLLHSRVKFSNYPYGTQKKACMVVLSARCTSYLGMQC